MSDIKAETAALVAFLFGCVIGGFLGAVTGGTNSYHEMLNQAIKSGHAEYYLDANNERQWRWKEIK